MVVVFRVGGNTNRKSKKRRAGTKRIKLSGFTERPRYKTLKKMIQEKISDSRSIHIIHIDHK